MTIAEWIARNVLRMKQVSPSRIVRAIVSPHAETWGEGPDWALEAYGEYYAKSVPIYAAIKLRADSITRPPVAVFRQRGDEAKEVEDTHPLAQLMRKVNPFWTGGDLWRATSIYLDLWGSCFWALTKAGPDSAPTEIWPLRPDKVRILADKDKYIQGFIYDKLGASVPFRPDEVIWFRHFNPLNELAALSPMAPLRLSADMGQDALKSNRNLFKRGLLLNNIFFNVPEGTPDAEIAEFEKRLAKRFSGPDNAHRPMIAAGLEAKNLGLSPKDMEHIMTLRWSLEDVCRVYGVPKPLLGDLERATYANVDGMERIFWRNTIVPYLTFLQGEVNEMLAPQFGPDLFIKFDLSEIEALQENVNNVWERLRQNVNTGLMTINEAREQLGMDALPWGDSWWAPMTLLPVTSGATPFEGEEPMAPKVADFSGDGHRRYVPPALTDAFLDRIADINAKRLDRHERRFLEAQNKLFALQLRDVLRRLRANKGVKQGPGDPIFDAAEWIEKFILAGKPLFIAALRDSAEAQVAEFGLGIAFDVTNPLVSDALVTRTAFWAQRVNGETAHLLAQELQEAYSGGESIKQIQERVEKVFRFNSTVRSERIARTEMLYATNKGALEAYRQSGVVEQKIWLAVLDDRTRQHHVEAHRQVVPFEGKFEVGGELLDGPGDGSPANVVNCRCSVAPVIGKSRTWKARQYEGERHKV